MRADGLSVTAFWYNPNVMPYREYKRRRGAFRDVCNHLGIEHEVADVYEPKRMLTQVLLPPDKPGRCARCYGLRLTETAARADAGGFDAFATTLAVSSHQDQDVIRGAAAAVSRASAVPYLDRDFRAAGDDHRERAKAMGVYVQRYCGCVYSEEERYRK